MTLKTLIAGDMKISGGDEMCIPMTTAATNLSFSTFSPNISHESFSTWAPNYTYPSTPTPFTADFSTPQFSVAMNWSTQAPMNITVTMTNFTAATDTFPFNVTHFTMAYSNVTVQVDTFTAANWTARTSFATFTGSFTGSPSTFSVVIANWTVPFDVSGSAEASGWSVNVTGPVICTTPLPNGFAHSTPAASAGASTDTAPHHSSAASHHVPKNPNAHAPSFPDMKDHVPSLDSIVGRPREKK